MHPCNYRIRVIRVSSYVTVIYSCVFSAPLIRLTRGEFATASLGRCRNSQFGFPQRLPVPLLHFSSCEFSGCECGALSKFVIRFGFSHYFRASASFRSVGAWWMWAWGAAEFRGEFAGGSAERCRNLQFGFLRPLSEPLHHFSFWGIIGCDCGELSKYVNATLALFSAPLHRFDAWGIYGCECGSLSKFVILFGSSHYFLRRCVNSKRGSFAGANADRFRNL